MDAIQRVINAHRHGKLTAHSQVENDHQAVRNRLANMELKTLKQRYNELLPLESRVRFPILYLAYSLITC